MTTFKKSYLCLLTFVLGCHNIQPVNTSLELNAPQNIVNGKELPISDPATRTVFALKNQHGLFCSATAINSRVLLTAAHCLDIKEPKFTITSLHIDSIEVLGFIQHPDWPAQYIDRDNWFNDNRTADVALVVLKRELPKNSIFTNLELNLSVPDGTVAEIRGYGVNEEASYIMGRRNAIIETPKLRGGPTQIVGTPASTILAAPNEKAAAVVCAGDSGGPIYVKNADHKLIQIGVINTSDSFCIHRHSFLKLSAVKDWLKNNLELAAKVIANENVSAIPESAALLFRPNSEFKFECTLDQNNRSMCKKKFFGFTEGRKE